MNNNNKNTQTNRDENHFQINHNMKFRFDLQTFMNNARTLLNMGKFNPKHFKIVDLVISSNKLPGEFDGYKIVQITDIHLGQWLNKEKLDGVVQIINNLEPDCVVLTGDFLSYQANEYLNQLTDSLSKLQPKDVTLSVLGNHDHWTNPEAVRWALRNAGVINLDNDIYTLKRGSDKLQIAGVDSITVGYDDIKKVESKLDYDAPAIMLAHEPDFADTTAKLKPFILQLSGHSHGGQFELPGIRTPIRGRNFRKYPVDTYQVGDMIQYTNRGIGTNSFWFRINSFYEITRITLKTKKYHLN